VAATKNVEAGNEQRAETLPFYHRDPFDRLIITQATNELV
jgi:PIN domain nuclease of toxin-antitoxin system